MKQMTEVCRRLQREGFSVSRTRKGHLRFSSPDLISPVFAPSTPSDHRAVTNLIATLKRLRRRP
jgi:predicted RNA binding protein YcfA (HicA-like mRNA interferase family)